MFMLFPCVASQLRASRSITVTLSSQFEHKNELPSRVGKRAVCKNKPKPTKVKPPASGTKNPQHGNNVADLTDSLI
jgi:hypothetical protein